ncbi:MAG: hypothetical protein HPY67_02490 [Syntrophaceae bacterium]|nr:hypothetical protein [Syntrophaceae bacterium]
MAERGLLRDVEARKAPAVSLGPEFTLHDKVNLRYNSRFKAILTGDGHGHVFVIDELRAVHHFEIAGNEVLLRETLGAMSRDEYFFGRIDAVEYPKGALRVVAGDKMFIRSGQGGWTEIKGNRCERFIPVGDDLLCTFIAKGEDLGAPKRRDWLVGWFILVPVILWSDVRADKLVIARESRDGWTVVAVFDAESAFSARSDYVLGADRRGLQFLYRSSGGSYAFFAGGGAGGAGIGGTGLSDQQVSYARVEYERLFERPSGSDTETKDRSAGWLRVTGKPLPPPPFTRMNDSNLFREGKLDRCFTVNGVSGEIEGLLWVYQISLNDGLKKIDGSGFEHPWVEIRVNADRWAPHFEIVAADDLPEPGYKWSNDTNALIRSDVRGNDHVLLVRSKPGFWTASFENCYFVKTAAGWSAPVVLGAHVRPGFPRDLALDDKGNAFAVWIDQTDAVKGRWISIQH